MTAPSVGPSTPSWETTVPLDAADQKETFDLLGHLASEMGRFIGQTRAVSA